MSTFGVPRDSLFGAGTDAAPRTDAHAFARRSDPVTSHLAAESVDVAGDEAYALACIRESGGLTAAELEAKYRVNRDGKIRKRLAGLERKGLIYKGITRTCRVGGRLAATYWAEVSHD